MQRQELGKFFRVTGNWSVPGIHASVPIGCVFDLSLANPDTRQCFWRIFAIGTADYAIRPSNPALIMGGPYIRLSTDDPRLSDPGLQYIPGGDGETCKPLRRYQLLELDQSWIVAERFENEPLAQTTVGWLTPRLNVPGRGISWELWNSNEAEFPQELHDCRRATLHISSPHPGGLQRNNSCDGGSATAPRA
jgi:hypothetical protein